MLGRRCYIWETACRAASNTCLRRVETSKYSSKLSMLVNHSILVIPCIKACLHLTFMLPNFCCDFRLLTHVYEQMSMNVLSMCTTHLNIHNTSTRSHSSEEENSVSMQAFSNLVNVSNLVNLSITILVTIFLGHSGPANRETATLPL